MPNFSFTEDSVENACHAERLKVPPCSGVSSRPEASASCAKSTAGACEKSSVSESQNEPHQSNL